MKGFFEILSEFLESDLAKSYGWVIVILIIICMVISCMITSFVFKNIIVPAKIVKLNDFKRDNEELNKNVKNLESEISDLKKENQELKSKLHHFKLQEALEADDLEQKKNKAFKKFTKANDN